MVGKAGLVHQIKSSISPLLIRGAILLVERSIFLEIVPLVVSQAHLERRTITHIASISKR